MVNFKSLVPWRNHSVQTPTAREELFDPFLGFRRKIDLIFEDFFESAGWRPFGGTSGGMPAIDFEETEKEFVITAEWPGVSGKDIDVDLSGDLLTIKGEKKSEHENRDSNGYRLERQCGSFERSVHLPFEVKDQQVEGKFNNGVLAIRLPKPGDLRRPSRRIEVKSG
jgi:HSP20 family protein